ncbi:MAG: phytanoyl-CoA dioxygenase family protein [Bacteroidia bacterium]
MKKESHYPKFALGNQITKEQIDFFNERGFIHFENVFSNEEIQQALDGYQAMVDRLIKEETSMINGIPILFGLDENNKKMIHRMPFSSLHSKEIQQVATHPRLKPIAQILQQPNARFAENEKDGVVFNHYINSPNSNFKYMGWHTDSFRDVFYGGKVYPMLNVGIYLDDSSEKNGGLRIIPGTQNQKVISMLLRKTPFISNDTDKNEMLVSAKRGDVVIHHGSMWHRVAPAPKSTETIRRRVMYIPVVCDKYQPKHSKSKTPLYHLIKLPKVKKIKAKV